MKQFFYIFLFLLLLYGCRKQEDFKGFYSADWEYSQFEPCQALGEWWWLTSDSLFFNRYDSVANYHGFDTIIGPTVFIKVKGILSDPGKYGHLEMYSRELEAKQIVQIEFDSSYQNLEYELEFKHGVCSDN